MDAPGNPVDDAPEADVLVVGAGPVGLVLACELARRDVAVRIIDVLPAPRAESRAILVHARTLEMLDRLAVADTVVASGVRMNGATMRDGARVLTDITLDGVDSPFPYSVATPQTETERILTEKLADLGVSVERGSELLSFDQDESHVQFRLRGADGREHQGRCGWIVGADGAQSVVRAQMGQALEGSFRGEWFLLGDVEADYDLPGDRVHTIFSADNGPVMVFPMGGRRIRIAAQIQHEIAATDVTLALLQNIVDARCPGIRITSASWLTLFEIHHAQVPHYRLGRAFVAGDAAHIHSPAAGQGMNTGMQDAANLGWKLALVVHGEGNDALLDSYHTERHPIAAQVIAHTVEITKMGTMHHRAPQMARDFALTLLGRLTPVRHALADWTEETDISYRHSPIVCGESGSPLQAGDHAPQVPGIPLREQLSAASRNTTVLAFGELDAAASAALAGLPQLVVNGNPDSTSPDHRVIADPQDDIAKRYGCAVGDVVLIRPDGYLGYLTHMSDTHGLTHYRELIGLRSMAECNQAWLKMPTYRPAR